MNSLSKPIIPGDKQDLKANKNAKMAEAKKAKADEFYTALKDIESEVSSYVTHFKNKVVFCNCDDPEWSNFWQYFHANFDALGLKRLIATYYTNNGSSAGVLTCHDESRRPDGTPQVVKTDLQGDGDFRSQECLDLLDQADIVCTNPPFSLFREFIALLMLKNKKFLVLGNQNAITYKEIFPLIMENRLWLGVDNGGTKWFRVPNNYEIQTESRKKIENGKKYFSMGSIVWFTNLTHKRRNQTIPLWKKHLGNEAEYPIYGNHKAINVNKVEDIPVDWDGAVGVPITFLTKYNPKQFQILGFRKGVDGRDLFYTTSDNKNVVPYFRILIQGKTP